MIKSWKMLVGALICMGALSAKPAIVQTEQLLLSNRHLTVTFEPSTDGPRLKAIKFNRTGHTHVFERSEGLGLALVKTADVNNPKLIPAYEFQESFRFAGADKEANRLVLRFLHDDLQTSVTYELEDDAPVLKKTFACKMSKGDLYLAGIVHWNLKPADLSLAWPQNAETTLGQPLILKKGNEGCFVTTEWPRAQFEKLPNGRIQLSCRPGYRLSSGNTKEVITGAIGFFEKEKEISFLDSARHSFSAHVARRVKPKLPFPVKFTTWGPWLGQARADRLLEIMDDLEYVGTDLVHFDAGWQWPDHPYTERMPKVRDADDVTWDRAMTIPERLPHGLLPILQAAKKRGMALSLWNDASGCVFVRENEDWAVRDESGKPVYAEMWEERWPENPVQSLANPSYRDALREFSLEQMKRYDLGGFMFDDNRPNIKNYASGLLSLASGWNTEDVTLRSTCEILEAADRWKPGIYRFLCMAVPWPWNLKYATHIHAGDPGTAGNMKTAMATDYPARALVYERYLAWRNLYKNFVPPWGIKGDIAGWSVQQASPIPFNLKHTEQLVVSGEGWTSNMMMCFATTAVRDIRFPFRQVPQYDKEILKEWLAWDRSRSQFIHNLKLFSDPPDLTDEGIIGISQVARGKGIIYLYNRSFNLSDAALNLDERMGLRPEDKDLSAYMVYPTKAPLGSGKLSYGRNLRIPIVGKDWVVVEVGLEKPEKLKSYPEYQREAKKVRRSFNTLFDVPLREMLDKLKTQPVKL